MNSKEFKGAKFVIYYNLLISACLIIGALALIGFSGKLKSGVGFMIVSAGSVLFGVFCGFSAIKYLRREKVGRVSLIVSFIIQGIISISGIISTYRVTDSVPVINLIMLFIAFWGIWYMTTNDAKQWIAMENHVSAQ